MEMDDSSQVPSCRADTVPRPGSGVLTALRARVISPFSPHFELIRQSIAWQVQDLATGHSTYWADTFIRRRLRGKKRTTLAASGGFIYVVYDSDDSHIVCNPQQEIYYHIQGPPIHGPSHRIAAMVVDAATQQYKIVLGGVATRGELMKISLFDSRVMTWRSLFSDSVVVCAPLSSVFLDGVLYVMFETFATPWRPLKLYSCDLDTRIWRFIDVTLPLELRQSTKTRPQLVAAAGRLFFMEYLAPRETEAVITVFIWQIALQGARPEVTRVAILPRVLDGDHIPEYWATVAPVQAVGCGDFIVVSTFLGRRWKWDAVQGTQVMAPFSPVEPLAAGHSFFVAPFDIHMPAER